jgi:hypothetical protein
MAMAVFCPADAISTNRIGRMRQVGWGWGRFQSGLQSRWADRTGGCRGGRVRQALVAYDGRDGPFGGYAHLASVPLNRFRQRAPDYSLFH